VQAPGYIVMRSPTNQVWFAPRGLAADKAEAEATVREHRLYAWADRARPGITKYIPVGGKEWASQQPNDLSYWQQLKAVLEPEPPEVRDGCFLAMLRSLGIEKGKPFTPDDRTRKILTDAAVAGDWMARATAYDKLFPDTRIWRGRVLGILEYGRPRPADQGFCAVRRARVLVLGGHRLFRRHAGQDGGFRPGLSRCRQGPGRGVAGWRRELSPEGAPQRTGRAILVGHAL
jgi:hypothetical protein